MKIRAAKIKDVKEIQKLVNHFASKKEMLPRSLNEIYENIQEYFVADQKNRVVGCVAIHVTWEDLAEIKSLAVEESFQNKGIGTKLVRECEKKAKAIGVKKVFALTFRPTFFEKNGYKKINREKLPHKIWGECVRCPMFPDCGEVAVIKNL